MMCVVYLLVVICISHNALITVLADPCGFNSQCASFGVSYGDGCGFCCVDNSETNVIGPGTAYNCGNLGYFDCSCPAGKGYYPASSYIPTSSSEILFTSPSDDHHHFGTVTDRTLYLHISTVGAPTLIKPTYGPTLGPSVTPSLASTSPTPAPTIAPIQMLTTGGYALYSVHYALTDTTCSQSPTSYTAYPLNSCGNGKTYTTDSSGNIYVTQYSGGSCTGTPGTPTKQTTATCTCYTSSCTAFGYFYAASLPIGVGPVEISTYYVADATGCSGTVSHLSYQSAQFCYPRACGGSSTTGYYSETCFGEGKPSFRPTVIPGGVTASPTPSSITLLKVSQDMSCAKCLMSTWGAIGSTAYNTQYSLMANTIQSSVYAYIASTIFASNMNITVTGFTQKSTSRRQLLTPTLTAAYKVFINDWHSPAKIISTLQDPEYNSALGTAVAFVTGSPVTVSTPQINNTSPTAAPIAPIDFAPLVKAVATLTAIISGIVGGVVACLCLSCSICFCCVMKCRRAQELERAPRVSETATPPIPPTNSPPSFFYILPSYPAMVIPPTLVNAQPVAAVASFVTPNNAQRWKSSEGHPPPQQHAPPPGYPTQQYAPLAPVPPTANIHDLKSFNGNETRL